MDCQSITIENLNFADARSTGREQMGMGSRGKTFRRTVSGMPTARFRDRLSGMAANRGIWLIAVDPAYTSLWGGQHWAKPLAAQTKQGGAVKQTRSHLTSRVVSRHDCAAVVIGRRGKQHRARTKARHRSNRIGQVGAGAPTPVLDYQRIVTGQPVSAAGRTVDPTTGITRTDQGRGHASPKTHLRESDRLVYIGQDGADAPSPSIDTRADKTVRSARSVQQLCTI
jgi:hypothetical protein